MSSRTVQRPNLLYICIEPEAGSNLLCKYPNFLSKTEKRVFEEHVKVCRKCELDVKILKIFESDFKKYGKEICLERFSLIGKEYLSKKKYRQAAKFFHQALDIEPAMGILLWDKAEIRDQLIHGCPISQRDTFDKYARFPPAKGPGYAHGWSPEFRGAFMERLLKAIIGYKKGDYTRTFNYYKKRYSKFLRPVILILKSPEVKDKSLAVKKISDPFFSALLAILLKLANEYGRQTKAGIKVSSSLVRKRLSEIAPPLAVRVLFNLFKEAKIITPDGKDFLLSQ